MIGDLAMPETSTTAVFRGLSIKSIDRANKVVQNLGSWEEARDHAKRRIKELQDSLRVFNQKIKNGEPWPEAQSERQKPGSCHSV
jgi:hypothetical protein